MIVIAERTEKITFRVTEKENIKIQKKAKKANMTISEYLRYTSLNKKIIVIEDIKELTKELRGIGNNLNQLTILCHKGKITCPDISETKKKVTEIWHLLNSLTEKIKK